MTQTLPRLLEAFVSAFDAPRITDQKDNEPDERGEREAWIVALMHALIGAGFVVDVRNPLRLRVSHEGTPGIEVDVTCRRRGSDGGRFWFLGRDDRPLAPADQLQDAIVAVKGQTAVRL